jgi:hypothetical protein
MQHPLAFSGKIDAMPGRDNGFVARHYVPLADLDPRLADAMLEALRAEGIAAYVVPSTGRLGGYLEVHLPERPHDRLWVDREHHDRAAALLNLHGDRPEIIAAPADPTNAADFPDALAGDATAALPADSADSADDVWARLVADFDLPSDQADGRWPLAEDLPVDADGPAVREADRGTGPGQIPYGGQLGDGAEAGGTPVPRRIVRRVEPGFGPPVPESLPSEYDPLSILDEHFVPDPPPPLPRLRRGTRWALASILAGVVLIVGRAFWDTIPDAVALGVLAVVGGFIGLVAMMREDRPSDSDPDDGAVV